MSSTAEWSAEHAVYGAVMNSWGEPRSKTITWHDPIATAAAGAELSGLEFLLAVRDGVLPIAPIGALLDYRIVKFALNLSPDLKDHPDGLKYLLKRRARALPAASGCDVAHNEVKALRATLLGRA